MADERDQGVVDNDEAVYLTTTFRLGDAVQDLDVEEVGHILFAEPTPYAPLLSLASAPFVAVVGPSPASALVAQFGFLVLLIGSTYILGRRLIGPSWAVAAAALVATCPFVADFARSYQFALASAALFTAALTALVCSDRFRRWGPSLAFGILVGTMVLARTMMVAFAAVLLVVALLVWWSDRTDRVGRFLPLSRGLLVGVVIALPWYVANGSAVLDYLTGYGFGPESADFGPNFSPWTPSFWLSEPVGFLRDLYLPLAIVVVIGVVIAGVAAVIGARREGWRAWVRRQTRQGWLLLVGVTFLTYVAVTSSNNQGTGFLLPLVPVVVLLATAGFRWMATRDRSWTIAVAGMIVVVALNGAMKSGLVPAIDDPREVTLPAVGTFAVTDGRSRLDRQVEEGDYADGAPAAVAADAVIDRVAQGDCCPVLASSPSDYLLNTARLTMAAAAEDVSADWFRPVFRCGDDSVGGYRRQLRVLPGDGPRYLLTVDLGRHQLLPTTDVEALEEAATAEGFRVVETYPLTAERAARLWERDPGPEIRSDEAACP